MRNDIKTSLSGFTIIIILLVFPVSMGRVSAYPTFDAVIYGRGCLSCFLEYVTEVRAGLDEIGIVEVEVHYLESDPDGVKALEQLHERLRVPESMQGSVAVSFDGRFLFEGCVPVEIITDFLANHTQSYDYLVVFRDELRDTYKIMDEQGNINECKIAKSITECVGNPESTSLTSTLILVILSGLLDGINPCAFAVLLFFISLLFAYGTSMPYQQTRRKILTNGGIYIVAVYLSYLAIGLSMIRLISLSSFPHLIAKFGALIMISLGLIAVKDYLWPNHGPSLGISTAHWEKIRSLMHRFSYPATFVLGMVVSVFEFPCTGGIYVAILGLLALKSTFFEGLIYLLLYNVAFVFPLIIILALASNRKLLRFSITEWKRHEHKNLKLFSGLVMVTLGTSLLLFGII